MTKFIFIFDEDAEQIDVQKIHFTGSGSFFIWNEVVNMPAEDIRDQANWIEGIQRDYMNLDNRQNDSV